MSYRDYFDIDPEYFPQVDKRIIDTQPDLWKKFYPHPSFVSILKATVCGVFVIRPAFRFYVGVIFHVRYCADAEDGYVMPDARSQARIDQIFAFLRFHFVFSSLQRR